MRVFARRGFWANGRLKGAFVERKDSTETTEDGEGGCEVQGIDKLGGRDDYADYFFKGWVGNYGGDGFVESEDCGECCDASGGLDDSEGESIDMLY